MDATEIIADHDAVADHFYRLMLAIDAGTNAERDLTAAYDSYLDVRGEEEVRRSFLAATDRYDEYHLALEEQWG